LDLPSVELSMHLKSMELSSVELSITTCFPSRWRWEHGAGWPQPRVGGGGDPPTRVGLSRTMGGGGHPPGSGGLSRDDVLPVGGAPVSGGGSEARPAEAARRVTILATGRVRAIKALPTALRRVRPGRDAEDLGDGHGGEEETPRRVRRRGRVRKRRRRRGESEEKGVGEEDAAALCRWTRYG
jgi:hypothetical protein